MLNDLFFISFDLIEPFHKFANGPAGGVESVRGKYSHPALPAPLQCGLLLWLHVLGEHYPLAQGR